MDPIKVFRRYAVYLQVPKDVTKRIERWYNHQVVSQGILGCHGTLKRVCTQLKYWLIAQADGRRCVERAPWVAVTGAGFPRLFTGLQMMSQDTLMILCSLHKVFKPSSAKELPRQAVLDRFSDVTRPFSGSSAAISDALGLIRLGTRHLPIPDFSDYTLDSASIFDPNHEVLSSGLEWLHAFYQRNSYWLEPVEAVSAFFPFNPTKVPEAPSAGWFECLNRGGNICKVFDPTFTVMGEYQMSAEPGFKARAFFSPNQVVKACARPLEAFLVHIERTCGWSVRYLQTEAKVSQVQTWFADGDIVASIDQTAATDRFPVQLQLFTAHCLGVPPEYIRFVAKVSRGVWKVDSFLAGQYGQETIRLAVGQPMGVPFSMPLYTLSMISLLRGACVRWGFMPDFLVLGDDLVVRDQGLALWCHDFLPKIGVVVSTSKGVTSGNIAEFAGAFIGKEYYTFPGKMPVVDSKTWYSCSVRLAKPLPDGSPKASSSEQLEEAFWFTRVAALGCYGKTFCPIENRAACCAIIQRRGFSDEQLEQLLLLQCAYDIERLMISAKSVCGNINKGRLTSQSDAIARICEKHVDNGVLSTVLDRQDALLRKGFEMQVSRTGYELHDVLGPSGGSGFVSWLKPKGDRVENWVGHTLLRVHDLLKLDSSNWGIKYSILDQRLLLTALSDIVDSLRSYLWERRAPHYKREIADSKSLCNYLLRQWSLEVNS